MLTNEEQATDALQRIADGIGTATEDNPGVIYQLERIAGALERIANALEPEQHAVTPSKGRYNVHDLLAVIADKK